MKSLIVYNGRSAAWYLIKAFLWSWPMSVILYYFICIFIRDFSLVVDVMRPGRGLFYMICIVPCFETFVQASMIFLLRWLLGRVRFFLRGRGHGNKVPPPLPLGFASFGKFLEYALLTPLRTAYADKIIISAAVGLMAIFFHRTMGDFGIQAGWAFYVYSLLLLTLCEKNLFKAYYAVVCLHGIYNGLAIILGLLETLFIA